MTPTHDNQESAEGPLQSSVMYSPESESGVLSCCLQDESSLDLCMAKIPSDRWFYDLRHKTLWNALRKMHTSGKGVDLVTLHEELKNFGLMEKTGGMPYIVQVRDKVPTVVQLPVYLDELREKYRLRHVSGIMAETQLVIRDHPGESQKAIDALEAGMMVIEEGSSRETVKDGPQAAQIVLDVLDTYTRGTGMFEGISTGFKYLDKLIAGLRGGEMMVLAGRPAMGKTSFAMNIIEAVAIRNKIPVGFFSLEMPEKLTFCRLIFQMAEANFQKFRTGCMLDEDIKSLEESVRELHDSPIYTDFECSPTIMQLRAKARQMVKKHGVKVIVIDYFQLIKPSSDFGGNENLGLQEISQGLMNMAKELDVSVIILSQLNRDIEKDQNKNSDASRKPRMSDLRGTGSLEQDATGVMILYRPKLSEDEEQMESRHQSWDDTRIRVNLCVCKNRNGPTGDAHFVFHKSCTKFRDYHQAEEPDRPGRPSGSKKIDVSDYPSPDLYQE